jgi:hypothetical protein
MAEVAVRTIRWLSDPQFVLEKNPTWALDTEWFDSHMLWEQNILNDAACSAAAGRYGPQTWAIASYIGGCGEIRVPNMGDCIIYRWVW